MDRLIITTRARTLCSMYVRNLSLQQYSITNLIKPTPAHEPLLPLPTSPLFSIKLACLEAMRIFYTGTPSPSLTHALLIAFTLHLNKLQHNASLSLSVFFNSIQFNELFSRNNVPYVLKLQKPDRQAEKVMIKCYMHRFQCFCFWFACKGKPASPYRCSCMHECTEAVRPERRFTIHTHPSPNPARGAAFHFLL